MVAMYTHLSLLGGENLCFLLMCSFKMAYSFYSFYFLISGKCLAKVKVNFCLFVFFGGVVVCLFVFCRQVP